MIGILDEGAATFRSDEEMVFVSSSFHPQFTCGDNIMPRRAKERGNLL